MLPPQRQHEKRSIYSLNDEEELTHYGQSLADIEMHSDIVDSDSDTEGRGALSGEEKRERCPVRVGVLKAGSGCCLVREIHGWPSPVLRPWEPVW